MPPAARALPHVRSPQRVPVIDVSMVDVTCILERPTTYEAIKDEVRLASETYAKGIVGYTEAAVVSSDFIGETRSTVFDASAGLMLSPTFVKLISWYDNEWGYSTRLCDLIQVMADADRAADAWWTRAAQGLAATAPVPAVEPPAAVAMLPAIKPTLPDRAKHEGERSHDSVMSALALDDPSYESAEVTTPTAMYHHLTSSSTSPSTCMCMCR